MEPGEYINIAAVETRHWYYAGKREIARYWITATVIEGAIELLDCGAGTGRFAQEMSDFGNVFVLDDHEESLAVLKTKFPAGRVLRVSATGIPLAADTIDVVTALDVLEHIKDDGSAVAEMGRVLRREGVVVATVPASMKLWSDWDEALHHYRRYTREELIALFPAEMWEILHVNYTNVPVFPVVWLLRKWRRLRGHRGSPARRAEHRIPPRWLNSLLRWTFVTLGKSRIPFPFGVSLILVARKR